MEKNYIINVCAEDGIEFYLKTEKSAEEIKDLLATFPDFLAKETETEQISDSVVWVRTGIQPEYEFDVLFSDGQYDGVVVKDGKQSLEDISELMSCMKKHLGDAVSALSVTKNPQDFGFTFTIQYGKEDYRHTLKTEGYPELYRFIREFMGIDDPKLHEIDTEELQREFGRE